jgi:hypothetical protein
VLARYQVLHDRAAVRAVGVRFPVGAAEFPIVVEDQVRFGVREIGDKRRATHTHTYKEQLTQHPHCCSECPTLILQTEIL